MRVSADTESVEKDRGRDETVTRWCEQCERESETSAVTLAVAATYGLGGSETHCYSHSERV